MSHEHHHNNECCAHEHHHEEESPRKRLILIILTAILLAVASFIEKRFSLPAWQMLLIYLVPYFLIGSDTLKEAAEGIAHGDPFDEHLLMSVATIGALCIGFLPGAETAFPEAVFVMLFFQVGELFEGYAEGRSRASISHLMEIRPDIAHVERGGALEDVNPLTVLPGETMVVRPGEKVPLDGVVLEGSTSVDTKALTGESVPRDLAPGDEILSGCVNLTGAVKVQAVKAFSESTVTHIIEMVENAGERKSHTESFITRFARIYTPIVVGIALVLAVIPPLFSGSFMQVFPTWLYRALMVLVISCPCALVISVPLAFFGGIGGASRKGILVKGASFLDSLAKVGTVVFDKTGTLTHGQFVVDAVHPDVYDAHHLLHLAAHVERFSTHPVAVALRDAFPEEATDGCHVSDVEELAGMGVRARVEDDIVCVGNPRMMEHVGAKWHNCPDDTGTVIHIAINGQYAGHIVINDKIKKDSVDAVTSLRKLGVKKIEMLTGDRREVAEHVAATLGLDGYHAELLPAGKVEHLEALLASGEPGDKLAFVGDGINDAPVLALADVGIAMGGLGSDAALEAADAVVMDDKPSKVALAVRIARRTIGIARQNIWFAIGVKVAVLLLAAFGVATMWMAVFADVGVTVLAVLNAMRALKV